MNYDDFIWYEAANYNNNDYDDINYRWKEYEEQKSVILPVQQPIVESKSLLRSIDL